MNKSRREQMKPVPRKLRILFTDIAASSPDFPGVKQAGYQVPILKNCCIDCPCVTVFLIRQIQILYSFCRIRRHRFRHFARKFRQNPTVKDSAKR